jgi:hypothetical protein
MTRMYSWVWVLVSVMQRVSVSLSSSTFPLMAVKWMHIPKASSWLGDFIILYSCPKLRASYDNHEFGNFFYDVVKDKPHILKACSTNVLHSQSHSFGWHDPYLSSLSNGSTVALFRNPSNRVISAFLFGDIMLPSGHIYSHNATLKDIVRAEIRSSKFPIIAYGNLPGIKSCQVKMVLGHYCGVNITISASQIQEAKRRVEVDFAFVGKKKQDTRFICALYVNIAVMIGFFLGK